MYQPESKERAGTKAPAADRREPARSLRRVTPPVDIYEDQERLYLLADLPGVSTEQVKIDVEKDVLTISAAFVGEGFFPGEAAYSELAPVEYFRAFALGEDLDAARISATMRNGVLELELPKAERAKTKKIKVELA